MCGGDFLGRTNPLLQRRFQHDPLHIPVISAHAAAEAGMQPDASDIATAQSAGGQRYVHGVVRPVAQGAAAVDVVHRDFSASGGFDDLGAVFTCVSAAAPVVIASGAYQN